LNENYQFLGPNCPKIYLVRQGILKKKGNKKYEMELEENTGDLRIKNWSGRETEGTGKSK